MKYCTRCVMPDTKPDLRLDERGVCSACLHFEQRAEVDWCARRAELEDVLARYRGHAAYDCIVPVSGGKDSTYQAIKLRELGLRPLLVNAATCDLSLLGRRNLDNLRRLGFDLLEYGPDLRTRRKLNRLGLQQVGDISWPEHVAIFTVPVQLSVRLGIPLIVWGENSQNEYGGPAAAAANATLTRRWLEEFGGLLGLRVSDVVGCDGITERDLAPYQYPSNDELQRAGTTGIFLGHYLPWDGLDNALVAQAHGLETYPHAVEGSLVAYENLDNHHTGIHDYFKWLKYGYGRATDLACMHVRRGRMSRGDALQLVRERDGRFPWTYLGKPLADTLAELDMTVEDFERVCDSFTNWQLFKCRAGGVVLRDRDRSLQKVLYDNPPPNEPPC